jgi:alkanesulfonate monooxygenase SsuD/methylene tetrahydromethanopterin reductase-like flavin-dependent oxidoreductase (luciferase family)
MARPMKIGYHIPEVERQVSWREILELVTTAEDAGFDSVWVPDHLMYRFEQEPVTAPWECWTLLSAIAAATKRVELGPLVLCTAFRNPAMIAKMAATIDEISGGRFVLGLGAGWHKPEFDAYGVPFDHRASRFEEAFTIIRTLLREGAIDFAGQYYQARDCELVPRGPSPNGPALMVGSKGDRVLDLTMPYVDAWNAWHLWWKNDPAQLPALLAEVDRAAEKAGRDPKSLKRTTAVFVARDPESTHKLGAEVTKAISGTPEQVAEQLSLIAAAGIDEAMMVFDPNTVESIEWFAQVLEVLDRHG